MHRKIILFACVVVAIVLALSSVSIAHNRSEYAIKEEKLISSIQKFIEIQNNAETPEYKTMYWEMLSKQTRDKLIQQRGSLEAAQSEVWIILQQIVDAQRHVELLGIEYMEIVGNVATVVLRVRVTELNKDPVEISTVHKYRWENEEWRFIDWLVEPEMYQE